MSKPNRDLEMAGWSLQNIVAVNVTAALEHITRELHALDGHVGGGDPGMRVQSTSELTSVEAVADERWRMRSAVEELRDAKADVLSSIRALNELCNALKRLRAPKVPQRGTEAPQGLLCSAGQVGKEGADVWGDPDCPMPAVKSGMCQAHSKRWYRHRQALGIDVSMDHEPAR